MRSNHRRHIAATVLALPCIMAFSLPIPASAAGTRATLPTSGTQFSLRSAEGMPLAIRQDSEGLQRWEYAATRARPAMEIRFDREGRVSGARWLRGSADFAQVLQQHLSMQDTLALLGQPDSVEVDRQGVAWRYRTRDSAATVIRFGADRRALPVK